jgi:hypothetical protein
MEFRRQIDRPMLDQPYSRKVFSDLPLSLLMPSNGKSYFEIGAQPQGNFYKQTTFGWCRFLIAMVSASFD